MTVEAMQRNSVDEKQASLSLERRDDEKQKRAQNVVSSFGIGN